MATKVGLGKAYAIEMFTAMTTAIPVASLVHWLF